MDSTRTLRGEAPAPASGPVCLTVVKGPDLGLRLELSQGTAIVGSGSGADLKLSDPTVSRQHLRLELARDGIHAVDLGSRNGTFLAGARIQEARILAGSRLKLGDTELAVDPLGTQRVSPGSKTALHGLLGQSAAMREIIATLERVAPTDTTVLLQGETGTGKEVAARAIHAASGRKGPLVVFDCGATSPALVASELFGHVRGAFTDARADRVGAAEAANGGTLFLDEVGELDVSLQPALLRLLEAREVRPVGSNTARSLDVRVVAATNRELAREVERGRFRQDLLFRLAVVTVHLPPLRERLEDIGLLAAELLTKAGVSLTVDEGMIAALRSYAWPGNVRELRNVLLRAAALGGQVSVGGQPAHERAASAPQGAAREESADAALDADYHQAREAVLARFEKEYVAQLVRKHQGNVSQAAREAGIGRAHLYRLMKKHHVDGD